MASPATARASRVLPVPGGPTISTPRGAIAPARRVAGRLLQEVHHFPDLGLPALIASHVGERRLRTLLVEHLRLRLADPERALQLAAGVLRQLPPQIAEDEEGQEQDDPRQHLGGEGGPCRLGGYLDARALQVVEKSLTGLLRDHRRVGVAVGEGARCRPCRRDVDGLHLVGRDVVQELRVVERDLALALGRRQREEQQEEKGDGEGPEKVAPRGRRPLRRALIPLVRRVGLIRHESSPLSSVCAGMRAAPGPGTDLGDAVASSVARPAGRSQSDLSVTVAPRWPAGSIIKSASEFVASGPS